MARRTRHGTPPLIRPAAFTLVELLVVITVIAVLLAMLAPARERAIYQAELAVCSANLSSIANSAAMYASSNQRAYPYRPCVVVGRFQMPNNLFYRGSIDPQGGAGGVLLEGRVGAPFDTDDRPYLRDFGFGVFVDPLSGGIDVRPEATAPETWVVFGNYALWFGMGFPGHKRMVRMGDGLTSNADGVERRLSILAGDLDTILPGVGVSTYNSHPDEPMTQNLVVLYNEGGTTGIPNNQMMSQWQKAGPADGIRGKVDSNHAYADGSVHRFVGVEWNEYETGRMVRVPQAAYRADVTRWNHVPAY
jgi:prepilin-type N-terminal cleavage/methylation domain-containing protein